MEAQDAGVRRKNHCRAMLFVVSKQKLFLRASGGLCVVVPVSEWIGILKSLHEHLGHWNSTAMMKVVTDQFW